MSWVNETVLPAALAELQKCKDADQKVIRMLRLATGTPQYVLDAEDAEAGVSPPLELTPAGPLSVDEAIKQAEALEAAA